MEWILTNFPILIFVFIVYSIVNAVKRAREKQAEHEASGSETEEQRRVREIQERIRRIAAERRGGRVPADQPPPRQVEAQPPPLDPFGGPLKRMLEEFDTHVRPVDQPPPLTMQASRAEAERQERLAEELRSLEEAKTVALRRAAHVAQAKREQAGSEAAQRTAARGRLLADLRDADSVRRAFVLREVLGPPVGLR